MGYRNVGLYMPFLPVCWFLKTDRYFFYSISTDVSKIKFKKVPVHIKNGGYILLKKVLHYLRAFSYSPYISLACMCVTVPTESNKYWYYAMYGTLLKKRQFSNGHTIRTIIKRMKKH
jgi:hypothetical protein